MATTTVGTCLLQAFDIIEHVSAQVVLDLHIRKHGGQIKDLLVGQLADAAGRVDVEAGEESGRGIVTDAEEGLKGFLYHGILVPVSGVH